MDSQALGSEQAFLWLPATVTAAGYTPLRTEQYLGISPPTVPGSAVVQTASGAVLQDSGSGITLLIPPGAAPAGVTFHYTPLFRGDAGPATATPTATPQPTLEVTATAVITDLVTATATPETTPTAELTPNSTEVVSAAATPEPAITAEATITLTETGMPEASTPIPTSEVTPSETATPPETATAEPTFTVDPTLTVAASVTAEPTTSVVITENVVITAVHTISDSGVSFYQLWQLEALQASQPITHFPEPLLLLVDARWLVQGGIDPNTLSFWSREQATDSWQMETLNYDAERQLLVMRLGHFSTGGIGGGLDKRGDLLPSLKSISSDHFTGAATVNYPIEVPPGLRGMAPNLSLSYSSNMVDDVLLEAGDDNYEVQASMVGYGWNLNGLSYIDRSLRGDKGYYNLVLQGIRSNINGGRSSSAFLDEDYFTRIQPIDPTTANGQFHGWLVTATDGATYTFGDVKPSEDWPASPSNKVTAVSMYLESDGTHAFDRWYLKEAKDTSGNRMTFQYDAQRGAILNWNTCANAPANSDRAWYTRSVVPTEIRWSGNPTAGLVEKLRVRFEYSDSVGTGNRLDIRTPGYGASCTQPKYFAKRLKTIFVEVLRKDTTNTWDLIRKYELTQSHYAGSDGDPEQSGGQFVKRHMLLDQIQHYGSNGSSLLNTYSFSYASYLDLVGSKSGSTTNNLRLASANNGWGGLVEFTYQKRAVDACAVVCPGLNNDQKYRYPLVTSMTKDGLGNQIRTVYAYANSAVRGDYSSNNDLYAREFMGYGTTTVTHYEIAPVGTTSTSDIRYEELNFTQGSPQSLTTTLRDPRLGRMTRHKTWSKTQSTCPSYYNNGAPVGGRCLFRDNTYTWGAYRRNSADGSWPAWTTQTSGPFWVRQDQIETWDSGATSAQAFTYNAAKQGGTQYGNLTDVVEYDGSVATGAKLRTTTTLYVPNTNSNIVNKPARQLVLDNNDACKAETRFIYDDVDGVYTTAPTKGLLAKTQKAITACSSTASVSMYSADWQETRMAYDTYGNQTVLHLVGSSASVGNQWFNTSYDDAYKLFPTQQTQSPSSFTETGVYYGVNENNLSGGSGLWGQMKEHCAVNGLCTQQSYDEFGRPLRRWERVADTTTSLPSDSSANVLWSYRAPGFYGSSHKTSIVTEWRSPRCYGNFTRNHYNGLGQLVLTQQADQDYETQVDGCGATNRYNEIETSFAYEGLGQQSRASVPVRYSYANTTTDANAFYKRQPSFGQGSTTTTYDALSRPVNITHPNGNQNYYTYSGRATAFWGKARSPDTYDKVLKRNDLNGLGYLQYIRTYTSSGTQDGLQTLTHDVTGNLTGVSHAGGAGSSTMTYDLLGNKKTMTDADLGSWSYAYDRQGNLTRQTDARGKTICLYYDNLGRLAGKHFRTDTSCPTSVATYDVRYTYDQNHSGTNRSRGQLTYVTSGDWEKWLDYNSLGLVSKEWVRYFNPTTSYFTLDFGYDNAQRPNTLTYNGGEVVTTSYNSMGLPNKLTSSIWGVLVTGDTNNDKDTVDATDGANYDEAGRLRNLAFPGAIWRYLDYAPWSEQTSRGGRLSDLWVGYYYNNNINWYDYLYLKYTYDSFGNIQSLQEVYNEGAPTTETYAYDAQNRLTTGPVYTYSYDAAGRLTSYDGASVGVDNTFPTHGLKSMGSMNLNFYDANGNRTWRLTGGNGGSWHYLLWDHENRLQEVDSFVNGQIGPALERYAYDADGQRVKKEAGGVTTYYPSQFYEQSGSTITKYYYFNGQRIAQSQNNALTILHTDHLGSVRYLTNSGGFQTGDRKYFAYGRQRSGSATFATDHRFTGQKEDGVGLMYYNARYYDPQLGTFLSPDTLVPDPTELIDYNRYSYARGNPLKYNDPSGHKTSKPDWWPDFLPYTYDLPDGMTQDDFITWLSENNIPTTWGVQGGGDVTIAPYLGATSSFEGVYMFNWLSGEVILTVSASVGLYTGTPDLGFSGHGGLVYYVGASSIKDSVVGLSEYQSASGELEAAFIEGGMSGTWSRARKNESNTPGFWNPGETFTDPVLNRTVDSLAVNVSKGVDVFSTPLQWPPVPFDLASSNGLSETAKGTGYNVYSAVQKAWNWLTDW